MDLVGLNVDCFFAYIFIRYLLMFLFILSEKENLNVKVHKAGQAEM